MLAAAISSIAAGFGGDNVAMIAPGSIYVIFAKSTGTGFAPAPAAAAATEPRPTSLERYHAGTASIRLGHSQ